MHTMRAYLYSIHRRNTHGESFVDDMYSSYSSTILHGHSPLARLPDSCSISYFLHSLLYSGSIKIGPGRQPFETYKNYLKSTLLSK